MACSLNVEKYKKKTGKSHGVERRCSRFSAIFDGEIGVAVRTCQSGGEKKV